MNRRTDITATHTGLVAVLLLAIGLAAPAARAQVDARWNALYDRIIRLEHQMKAMKRDYERRIRRLEAQLRAARRQGPATADTPAGKTPTPPATPARRGEEIFAPLPPLRQPRLSVEVEGEGTVREEVLGRLRADDLPATPSASADRARNAPSLPGSDAAAPPAAGGPIALPGAVAEALRDAGTAPPAAGTAPGTPATGAPATGLLPGQVAVAPLPPPGDAQPSTGAVGTVPAQPAQPAPQPVAIPPELARLSAEKLLQQARQNFLARRYDKAEQAYRAWLARFADRPQAADARFELGETLYIQGRFREAGQLFVQAYRAAPQGRTAPRALLRLGQALKRMGKKAEACKALKSLRQRYPDSRAAKWQAPREMKRLKCKG